MSLASQDGVVVVIPDSEVSGLALGADMANTVKGRRSG